MTLFVDLCWTLVPTDTTRGLLDHLLADHRGYRAAVRRWDSFPGRVVRRVLRARWGDPGRRVFLSYLRGWEAGVLAAEAAEWFGRLSSLKAGVECLEAKRTSHDVFLLSASIEPVVSAASRRWNLPIAACSRLGWDARQRATGALEIDLVGRKLPAVQQWLSATGTASNGWSVLTDDPSDLALVQAAREAWVVVHPRHARFWRRHLPLHAQPLGT